MKAVTWHGKRDVRVDDVPDPQIEEPTDAIIRITTTGHLRLRPAPVRGPRRRSSSPATSSATSRWGSSRRSGREVTELTPGDRVVIPFQISCGDCFMCDQGLQTQCETTQVREEGMGAALFGYTKLYGQVPGGQAEYLRVPQAQYTHIKVPDGPPGRALRLPVRRAADRLAGRRVRRRSRTAARCVVLGLGPDRRHGVPHRARTAARPRDRRRPRRRAARARRAPAASRCSTCASTTTTSPR